MVKNVVCLKIMIRYHDGKKHNSSQSNEEFINKIYMKIYILCGEVAGTIP